MKKITISKKESGGSAKAYFAAVLFLLMNVNAFAQAASGTWALTANGNAVTSGSVTAGSIVGGSGLTSFAAFSANGATAEGWTNGQTATDYFQFTISPAANKKLTVTSLSFTHSTSASTATASVAYSLNGFSTSTSLATGISVSTTATAYNSPAQSIVIPSGSTLTVRVYAGNLQNQNRAFRVRNMVISGTTCDTPIISTQPIAQELCEGSSLDLSVTASNADSYQWKRNGNIIAGATLSTYSVPSALDANSGTYTVEVTNACQTIVSSAVAVNVYPILDASVSISTSSMTVCSGVNTTFTATPVNGGAASYQWKLNGNNVGGNSATFSTSALADGDQVWVTMSSTTICRTGLPADSNVLTMTVNASPTFGSVSQAAAVCQNTDATINFTGLLPNSTSTISYKINNGATQTATNVMADGSGNASILRNLALSNNGQSFTVVNVERTDVSPACNFVPVSGNSATLQVNQNVTYYADSDGDGFGDLSVSQVSCFGAPSGYVTNSTDCDDTDNTKNTSYSFYLDTDNDGFGSVTSALVCAVNAGTPPTGYALNNTDCDDNNAAVNATFAFFTDADNDGFGTGGSLMVCAVDAATPPVGYALNNTDCDDSNALVNTNFDFYVDADGDGFGTGSLVSVCAADAMTAPAGYSVNAGDCNDNAASVNPGMSEVLFNGIDDNCDGNLDEGFQFTTQVSATQCGSTLNSISSLIAAISKNNATAYRFEVTNTSTNAVQMIERPLHYFSLTMLAQFDYATTYSIRVEMQRNGVWLGYYGPSCLVSSPAILDPEGAAQVSSSQCGITIPTISTLIATNSIPNVTGYRFRVTNLTDPNALIPVQTIDRTLHWFSLTMLGSYNYGTSYMIEVAVNTGSGFSQFGTPCIINSPAVISLTQCGVAVPAAGTLLATASKNKTTSYRFEITNLDNNIVITLDRPYHYFSFNMVPGFVPGAPYGIRVALMTSGSYSPFSEVCEITAPGTARTTDDQQVKTRTFDAVGYPNPFADSFTISTAEPVSVKVFDMTGRLLETVNSDSELSLGSKYPSGVYNVIVTSGEQSKTLRMIKR